MSPEEVISPASSLYHFPIKAQRSEVPLRLNNLQTVVTDCDHIQQPTSGPPTNRLPVDQPPARRPTGCLSTNLRPADQPAACRPTSGPPTNRLPVDQPDINETSVMASPGLLLLLMSSFLFLSIVSVSASPDQNQVEEVTQKKINKAKEVAKAFGKVLRDSIDKIRLTSIPGLKGRVNRKRPSQQQPRGRVNRDISSRRRFIAKFLLG
ncbi:uncharacterized protein LOC123967441 [Micropterus dolomieu]|uniref:uncharacterized protein LOC123967441 n=1 Tax=Micropterus dolomieu TaxID=147949 RepID=UPI001E8D1E5A|nr:uncharacterized protein LOC123967441 [Micropterus dolomieu]